MKTLRNLVLCLISLFSFHQATACGGWEEYDSYFRLFKPAYMIPNDAFGPITYSDEPWPDVSDWFSFEAKHNANISAWKEILPAHFSHKQIELFVYKSDVEGLLRSINGPVNPHDAVTYWVKENKPYVLQYLWLALKSEDHCNQYYYYWDEKPEVDQLGIAELLQKGLKEYVFCDDAFIKERYAFQLVKLMRYGKRYDECKEFWESHIKNSPRKNLIYYWTLDHIAGVQMAEGEKVKAWRNFMEVFQQCASRRYSSYYSIKIETDEDWEALYQACESHQEKETMHFIRASHMGSIALSDMEAIYKINPQSEYLPALICREVNKIESLYLQNNEKENAFYQLYFNDEVINEQLQDYLTKLSVFLDVCIDKAAVNDISLWQVSSAYTHFLLNDAAKTKSILALLEGGDKVKYKKQINILEALLLCTDKNKDAITRQNELEQLWSEDVHDFAYFLMRHPSNELPYPLTVKEDMWQLEHNLETPKLEALLELTQHYKNLSWFANYILERNYFNAKNQDNGKGNLRKVTNMLATSYLAEDKYEKAIEVFSSIAGNQGRDLEYNPFNYIINDNNRFSLGETSYSQLKFAKTMVAIQAAISNGTATAMDYYLLGNAHYNTSYFGYAWLAKAYYRSGSYLTGVYDCSLAYDNYIKAAKVSDDKEMQAKCLYLAAKANQNLYITKTLNEKSLWRVDLLNGDQEAKGHRAEFEKLKNNYADTEFYQRIISECQYFDYYVN